jgi:hypothetical protein
MSALSFKKLIQNYGEKWNILMATLSHQFCFFCPEKGEEPDCRCTRQRHHLLVKKAYHRYFV